MTNKQRRVARLAQPRVACLARDTVALLCDCFDAERGSSSHC
jgi:hypothetical protein